MLKQTWESSVPDHYRFQHRHFFTGQESEAEREEWREQQIELARQANIEVYCRKTSDGYDFGFKDFASYAAFRLNACGDPRTERGETCIQNFTNGVDPNWVRAAEMVLKVSGVDYDLKTSANQVVFSLDRFSEHAALRMLIESGEIDRMAETLANTKSFLGRVQEPGPSQGFGPRFS